MCELEIMNKKLTTLVTRNGVQASATASYAKRCSLFWLSANIIISIL